MSGLDPAAPQSVGAGRYRLTRRIAVGGMGEVWAAEDTVLSRPVAVKLLRRDLVGDPAFLERFRTEARLTAGLVHPGIAQVYDFGEPTGAAPAYLVMELVPGEPLSARLVREGRLDPEAALDVVGQTARAVAEAHRAGLVHRDLKPANLLTTPTGQVKVTDFGIARAVDAAALTRTGEVVGTAHYLSPEQALGRPATPASDVYALGLVLYEMLAGRRPFAEAGALAVARAHADLPPPPLPADVPDPARELVDLLLVKDPALRPPDADAVLPLLERARAGLRAPASGLDTVPLMPTTPGVPPTAVLPPATAALPAEDPVAAAGADDALPGSPHSPRWVWALVAALVVLVGWLAWSLVSRQGEQAAPGPATPAPTSLAPTSPAPTSPAPSHTSPAESSTTHRTPPPSATAPASRTTTPTSTRTSSTPNPSRTSPTPTPARTTTPKPSTTTAAPAVAPAAAAAGHDRAEQVQETHR